MDKFIVDEDFDVEVVENKSEANTCIERKPFSNMSPSRPPDSELLPKKEIQMNVYDKNCAVNTSCNQLQSAVTIKTDSEYQSTFVYSPENTIVKNCAVNTSCNQLQSAATIQTDSDVPNVIHPENTIVKKVLASIWNEIKYSDSSRNSSNSSVSLVEKSADTSNSVVNSKDGGIEKEASCGVVKRSRRFRATKQCSNCVGYNTILKTKCSTKNNKKLKLDLQPPEERHSFKSPVAKSLKRNQTIMISTNSAPQNQDGLGLQLTEDKQNSEDSNTLLQMGNHTSIKFSKRKMQLTCLMQSLMKAEDETKKETKKATLLKILQEDDSSVMLTDEKSSSSKDSCLSSINFEGKRKVLEKSAFDFSSANEINVPLSSPWRQWRHNSMIDNLSDYSSIIQKQRVLNKSFRWQKHKTSTILKEKNKNNSEVCRQIEKNIKGAPTLKLKNKK